VRSVEAPAFVIEREKRLVILPAFSKFTRGVRVEPTADREVHAIVESTVVGPLGGT